MSPQTGNEGYAGQGYAGQGQPAQDQSGPFDYIRQLIRQELAGLQGAGQPFQPHQRQGPGQHQQPQPFGQEPQQVHPHQQQGPQFQQQGPQFQQPQHLPPQQPQQQAAAGINPMTRFAAQRRKVQPRPMIKIRPQPQTAPGTAPGTVPGMPPIAPGSAPAAPTMPQFMPGMQQGGQPAAQIGQPAAQMGYGTAQMGQGTPQVMVQGAMPMIPAIAIGPMGVPYVADPQQDLTRAMSANLVKLRAVLQETEEIARRMEELLGEQGQIGDNQPGGARAGQGQKTGQGGKGRQGR